jgi:transposase-like protein
MARAQRVGDARRMRKQYSGEQRRKLIELVTAGAAVPVAARQLGVKPTTAYYWVRAAGARSGGAGSRRRPRPAATPTFVELVRAGETAATVLLRVGGAEVEVRAGFDGALLRAVVAALQGVAA